MISRGKTAPSATAASAKAAAPARVATPTRGRWAGIKSHQPRTPQPPKGTYRFKVIGFREGRTGTWSFIDLEYVEVFSGGDGVRPGDKATFLQYTAGDAGPPRVRAAIVAMAGFANDEEYDEWDPQSLFIDACFGATNEFSERGDTVVGRYVDAEVMLGKETSDGDHFREWIWEPVADAEQPEGA